MPTNSKQLIIFVKTPVPGQCKTRLIPLLGEQKASEFYRTLVSHCFKQLRDITDIDIAVYATPDIKHRFIQQLCQICTCTLHLQQGNSLGDRMHSAIQHSLQHYSKVVLIGTDCPAISQTYIQQAFDALKQSDIVFGPAEDGGYVLIGANKIEAHLFENIDWSTEKVLTQSLNNCQASAYNTRLLDTLRDIDTPEDYINLNQSVGLKYSILSCTYNTIVRSTD